MQSNISFFGKTLRQTLFSKWHILLPVRKITLPEYLKIKDVACPVFLSLRDQYDP